MKKKLNLDAIQSELRGGSAFFPVYKGSHSPTPTPSPTSELSKMQNLTQPISNVKTNTAPKNQGVPPPVPRLVPRTDPRPDHLVPKVKRPMKQRQPFDIYEDQYVRLKQIADSERGFVNGRGISQMVRDAIDVYLNTETTLLKKKYGMHLQI